MTRADGLAINELAAQCPDNGLVSVYSVFRDNAYESLKSLRPNLLGVVAEAPGCDGLAGMAMVSFDHCSVQHEIAPYALLNSLMVHPGCRRKGLARQISDNLIDICRNHMGDRGFIIANIQACNDISQRTVRPWRNQLLPPITVVPAPLRKHPPKPLYGVSVGPLETNKLEEFAHRHNTFYQDYNFYKPETASTLCAWLSHNPLQPAMHHCLVATDPSHNLLAGLAFQETHQLHTYHVVKMPAVMGAANKLLHVIPPDGVIREIQVSRLWFQPGQTSAARYLWDTARYRCRETATSFLVFFDPRSPLADVFRLKPWSIKTSMMTAVKGPISVDSEQLICPIP